MAAKRGYKLQEFVAHSTNVRCLSVGKKACRLLITGGDDHKVNLWAIGKPTSLMSLCGHTSPVESVAFDAAEILVLSGASTGAIKLWDLEEAKMVRTLTGHRSNCTAVEFHPFGEFFASGSTDTNLRIWDIRKKGCIHTYKGHTQGISTIKFTPDGRWVVSGGYDNVVKVWDLTAGRFLHDFTFHEGHIRSIDFHPLEFLLATGSADKTVKFWDLETFELIGSARPEATGVRSITFHPDGRTLFCGLDDSLKVYSWEPVICHDAIDMGWSTLGDICINEGKLLGCSYYRNSVGVWVADIKLIEPYTAGFLSEEIDSGEQNFSTPRSPSPDEIESCARSTEALQSRSPDYETKEIKNIYVDSTGGNPVASQGDRSLSSSKVVPTLDSKSNPSTKKQSPTVGLDSKGSERALNKAFTVPTIVPQDNPIEKDPLNSGRDAITFLRTKPGMLLRPAHVRTPSKSKNDIDKLPESAIFSNAMEEKECTADVNLQIPIVPEGGAQKSSEERSSNINIVAETFEKVLSPVITSKQENCDKSVDDSKGITSVKIVNGVAVVAGRTRTLVERFERQEKLSNEHQAINGNPQAVVDTNMTPNIATDVTPQIIFPADRKASLASNKTPHIIQEKEGTLATTSPFTIHLANTTLTLTSDKASPVISEMDGMPVIPTSDVMRDTNRKPSPSSIMVPRVLPEIDRISTVSTIVTPRVTREMGSHRPLSREDPQISGQEPMCANSRDITEDLMQTHDVFLSGLKSRLTKLQVVRHFWERNDTKGAINAIRKLPDHSVQADVISVLMEKMDILSLEFFSCLLPVLVGLLDSKLERHAKVSLEMLLKLVAVFGPVIHAAISAPPSVGVDLHAEQRLECCKQCFTQLQKIQQRLPALVRRGGLLAKCARELNLVLKQA
ncbi:hypothetical protein K2173_001602 [Erythroxylum novogranatense]|uniref:Katanin p80 WD40 repeat-containing subunit B1 homolog n=1 Tax=Erythroxylum novogranatense TaxID=1862640 RepID=A0AAV8T592_9ROSI|nr:hypothetical protein K2173_001602 [Erythroxylum novogranatense]